MLVIEPQAAFSDHYIGCLRDSGSRRCPVLDPADREASELAVERASSPFLRCEEPALVAALRRQGKWQGEKPAAMSTALLIWKGKF